MEIEGVDLHKKPVSITTSIPHKAWVLCKTHGWKWNDVFQTGLGVKLSNGDLLQRIKILEGQVAAGQAYMEKKEKQEKERKKPYWG